MQPPGSELQLVAPVRTRRALHSLARRLQHDQRTRQSFPLHRADMPQPRARPSVRLPKQREQRLGRGPEVQLHGAEHASRLVGALVSTGRRRRMCMCGFRGA
eukprot:scaffold113756_cov31-Tisochrysis_lutea.AAC.1